MKKLFLRAEFGPLWEPWEEDEIGRKEILVKPKLVLENVYNLLPPTPVLYTVGQ